MITILDKLKEFYRAFLGTFVVIGVFALVGLLYFVSIPAANANLIHLVIGSVVGYAGAIISFEFGSSRGSETKTAIMANNSTTDKNEPTAEK
jgi:hypothetical protein